MPVSSSAGRPAADPSWRIQRGMAASRRSRHLAWASLDHLHLAAAVTLMRRNHRGGRLGLNSVSVPIDGLPTVPFHRLPLWGVA